MKRFERTITDEEQEALFRELRASEKPLECPARERLILENMPLAFAPLNAMLRGRSRGSWPVRNHNELRSVAMSAIVAAVDGFDPSRGLKFSTYSCRVVCRSLREYILRYCGPVTIPKHAATDLMRLSYGREPLHPDCVPFAAAVVLPPEPIDADSERYSCEGGQSAVDDADEARRARVDLKRLMRRLSPREKDVVRRLYGFGRAGKDGPETFRSIGLSMGMTRQSVYAIEQRAIRKMRGAA